MTREEALERLKYIAREDDSHITTADIESLEMAIKALEQEHTKEETLKHEPILDKIKAEIEQIIEQERFARSVFRGEEKDVVKANQCTGSIMAYDKVISIIDKYRTGRSEKE